MERHNQNNDATNVHLLEALSPIKYHLYAFCDTNEERTYFLIDIPCHPGFMKETLSVEQIGVKGGVKEPNVTKDVTKDVTKMSPKMSPKNLLKDNQLY